MRTVFLTILVLVVSMSPVLAKKADDDATRKAKAALATFRKNFESENPEERLKAVAGLDEHPHVLVVDEIGRKVLPHKDLAIRELGARILGRMKALADRAGPFLKDHLAKNEEHPEVQVALIRAIGKLGYKGAGKELTKALGHCREKKYEWVTKEVIRVIVKLDDKPLVLNLLALMKVQGKGVARPDAPPGEECHEDGTKEDNKNRAKAEYERKHGKMPVKGKGKGAIVTIYWKDDLDRAVTSMTGQTFKGPREFEKWLKRHAVEFGLKKKDFRKMPKL